MESDKKVKKVRWRYFIDKPFQIRFIARFSVLILIGMVITILVLLVANLNKYTRPLYFKAKNVENMIKIVESVNSLANFISNLEEGTVSTEITTSQTVIRQEGDVTVTNQILITNQVAFSELMKDVINDLSKTTIAKKSGKALSDIRKGIAMLENDQLNSQAIQSINTALMDIRKDPEYQQSSSFYSLYRTQPTQAFQMSIDMQNPLNLFQLYLLPIIVISAGYLILLAIMGLFISHKMAGPVHRIKKTLQDVVEGKIEPKDVSFRLRKRDELKDLADALNLFIKKITQE